MNSMKKLMRVYDPVTIDEVQEAYKQLVNKASRKARIPAGFRGVVCMDDPAIVSLLPVGRDGMTTIQVEKSDKSKSLFFSEVVRLFNEDHGETKLPKFKLKRFSIQERKEKSGEQTKVRRTVLLCLRDQVAMRVLLNRIKQAGLVSGNWNDVFAQISAIHADLKNRKSMPLIIKTDISEFHPSVNREMLIELIKTKMSDLFDNRTMGFLEYAISGHPSAVDVPGLPQGLSVSVILAEFYAQQMNLSQLIPGVSVYRYADDILFIADPGTDADSILNQLDEQLSKFNLRRNLEKTKVITDGAFCYLGVDFEGNRVSIDNSRQRRWSTAVWAEVGKDIESYRIVAALRADAAMPDQKQLIRNTFREYKRGVRSSYWKLIQKVSALNG